MTSSRTNPPKIVYALAILSTAFSAGMLIWMSHHHLFEDLEVYELAAREFMGAGNIFGQDFETGGGPLPFIYPPFGALAFYPFALLGHEVASIAMLIISVLCLWFVMTSAFKAFHVPSPWLYALCLLGPSFYFAPIRGTLGFGQINIILMALVVADLTGAIPKCPRGILTGLAAAIKLTPLYFILYFLVKRDFKSIGRMFLTLVGTGLIAFFIHPSVTIEFVTNTVFHTTDRVGAAFDGYDAAAFSSNMSLGALNARNFDGQLVWLLLTIIVTAFVIFAAQRLVNRGEDFMAMLVIALACLSVSPISWVHHWVWIVPFVIALFLRGNIILAVLGFLTMLRTGIRNSLPDNGDLDWSLLENIIGIHYVIFALIAIIVIVFAPRPDNGWVKDFMHIPVDTKKVIA